MKDKTIYPRVTRGPLSVDHSTYARTPQPQGPKMGDMQSKVIFFGIAFFLVFTLVFAFSMGFGHYLNPAEWKN